MWILIFQRTLLDFILHILFFPIWWYGGGAKKVLIGLVHRLEDASRSLAPLLWMKYIFVPMFGQRDWQGRIVSFLVRFWNVIFRSIALAATAFGLLCVFILWIAFPMIVVYFLLLSFV